MNLARVHEAIAEVIPERECVVFRDRRYSWAQFTQRTRRLGNLLRSHGLGCHRERSELSRSEPSRSELSRSELSNWESGQDHVALYLYNGNEYLEGMLGAFKARCAPFNVNYRYVEEELSYLFDNADAKAVVYHAAFAPTLEKIRDRLNDVKLWLQVADESGNALLDGALDYESALASASPDAPPDDLSPDDLYILYTGGTTGMPKGVLWRQEDIFRAALVSGKPPESVAEVQERVLSRTGIRCIPSPPFMHGAAHWAAFNMWHTGGTVIVQSQVERLDPVDLWTTAEREKANSITLVGDAFARPLLDELESGRRYDLSNLKVLTSGGAILSRGIKARLREHLPQLRILDTLGSSETGSQGAEDSQKQNDGETGHFDMVEGNVVLKEDLSGLVAAGSDEIGWLARRGHLPLGYYKDPDKTARTFPLIDGVRYSVPGDRARLEAGGRLSLLGRDSVTINSGGEKIFAEEVEHALKHHPSVYDAVVTGIPNERWGSQVTAVVQLRPGEQPDDASLSRTAAAHIARYKLPKDYVYVDRIQRSPSGKADYRWAKETALARLRGAPD